MVVDGSITQRQCEPEATMVWSCARMEALESATVLSLGSCAALLRFVDNCISEPVVEER